MKIKSYAFLLQLIQLLINLPKKIITPSLTLTKTLITPSINRSRNRYLIQNKLR